MKKKKTEKGKKAARIEELERTLAKVRAEKIEALADAQAAQSAASAAEAEAEELIGLAAVVGEKLERARPVLTDLRAVLAGIGDGKESDDARGRTIDLTCQLVETLTGPIVRQAKTVKCGASATLQLVEGGAIKTVGTTCWAEHGHEGEHGDAEGRIW